MSKRVAVTVTAILALAALTAGSVAASPRLAGSTDWTAPAATRAHLRAIGERQAEGTVVLCLNAQGTADFAVVLHSSGDSALDDEAIRQVRGFRYEPVEVDGHPVPWCTPVTYRVVID